MVNRCQTRAVIRGKEVRCAEVEGHLDYHVFYPHESEPAAPAPAAPLDVFGGFVRLQANPHLHADILRWESSRNASLISELEQAELARQDMQHERDLYHDELEQVKAERDQLRGEPAAEPQPENCPTCGSKMPAAWRRW